MDLGAVDCGFPIICAQRLRRKIAGNYQGLRQGGNHHPLPKHQ